jgi:hypothetical protein
MRFAAPVLLLLLGCAHPSPAPASPEDGAELVGMWRLVEMVSVREDGTTTPSGFGLHPTGYIVYDRAGRMSVQIMGDPRPTVRDADHPTDAEAKAAYHSYVAYAGTYTYDSVRRVVTHRPEMATYPPYVGGTLSRDVRHDRDRVVLLTEPNPERVRLRLTWERVRPP